MLPFTYNMYQAYQNKNYINQNYREQLYNYHYELDNLSDESTPGDYSEINYLRNYLNKLVHDFKLIRDYAAVIKL